MQEINKNVLAGTGIIYALILNSGIFSHIYILNYGYMKIFGWNVNGIRAAVGKDFLAEFKASDADIYCIQETKAQEDQVMEALKPIEGYHIYAYSAIKKGYSSVAVLSRAKPLSVSRGIGIEEHDQEGRVLTLEYEEFYLINVYVPNSGNELVRLPYRAEWDQAFSVYLTTLRKKKPVIATGDFNVSHKAIDLARPKENYNKTAGFTQVEIDGLELIMKGGYVDAYRKLYPEKVQYTFWSARFGARARNSGWRIDYFLVDDRLTADIRDCVIWDQVMGSDHCPISLDINL